MKKLLVTLVIGTLLALPLSAMAMEKMSIDDMGDVVGQAGVSVGFAADADGVATTTTIEFTQLAWGDPDGVAGAENEGWLIINPTGTISIEQTIEAGETLVLDVATSDVGGFVFHGSTIPGDTSFLSLGLPAIGMNITVPAEIVVNLAGDSAGATTLGTLGLLNLEGLSVSQANAAGFKLYIWAH